MLKFAPRDDSPGLNAKLAVTGRWIVILLKGLSSY